MALTKEDQQWVKEMVEETLKIHIKVCPYGRSLLIAKSVLIGMLIMSAFAGGGAGAALMKFLLTR